MKRLCVYCGSRSGNEPAFERAAEDLATSMLKQALGLVYGGARIGLMGVIADTMLSHGAEVIGVIPESLMLDEVVHTGLTSLEVVHSMHERKQRMIDLSDGMVALPGGFGTLEEIFEALSWAQLGLHRKPCALLNVEGYFDGLLHYLDHAVRQGFIASHHRELVIVETEPEQLIEKLVRGTR